MLDASQVEMTLQFLLVLLIADDSTVSRAREHHPYFDVQLMQRLAKPSDRGSCCA